jgi:hypothetical protein
MSINNILPEVELKYSAYIGGSVLQQTIFFIHDEMDPFEVFEEQQVLQQVHDNYLPQEVFSSDQLFDWWREVGRANYYEKSNKAG